MISWSSWFLLHPADGVEGKTSGASDAPGNGATAARNERGVETAEFGQLRLL